MQKDYRDLVAAVARQGGTGMTITTLQAAIVAEGVELTGSKITVSDSFELGVRKENGDSTPITFVELIDIALNNVNSSLADPKCERWFELSKSKILLEQLKQDAEVSIPPIERNFAIRCSATKRGTVTVSAYSVEEAKKKAEKLASEGKIQFGAESYSTY